MSFYNDSRNVDNYIHMAEGFDGKMLIEKLKTHLNLGAKVLEIGMGPGKDYEILSEDFSVSGTDASSIFVDRYKLLNPDANVFLLDAVIMELDEKYDCFYSNKVLMHLTTEQMIVSLKKQKALLNDVGVLFHSLWTGENEEYFDGLRFVYYNKSNLVKLLENDFEIVEMQLYQEMEENDSVYIVLK